MDRGEKNFNVGGQVGVQGSNVQVTDFKQVWNEHASDIDLGTLAEQLGKLRAAMRDQGDGPDHDIAAGDVAAAEKAAKANDGPTALKHLKKAGQWALDVGTKAVLPVATEAIKKAMGL